VRLVLAVSLDGRLAPPEGGPAQLGGDGDRRALEQALEWADACLIGAGTLRAHESTCVIRDPQLRQKRVEQGRSPQPVVVVVSRQAEFLWSWRFFEQPLQRWLLSPKPPSQGFERWVPLGKTWRENLDELASLDLQRIVLLGGAGLVADMLQLDVVDELQLTLVPSLLGGEHTWVSDTQGLLPASLAQSGAWTLLASEMLGGDELLLRYSRQRRD
jgi:5-amino-6-(5-phosphoribosylamino)uracil reductase